MEILFSGSSSEGLYHIYPDDKACYGIKTTKEIKGGMTDKGIHQRLC